MERRSFLCGAGAGAPLLFENRSGSGSAAPFSGLERERERRSFELERCPPLAVGREIFGGFLHFSDIGSYRRDGSELVDVAGGCYDGSSKVVLAAFFVFQEEFV